MRRAATAVLAAALASAFAVPGRAAEPGVSDNEILIGSCSTLKQDIGMVEYLGATAYLQYVNDRLGGVHGRQIRVLFGDDEFTAPGAAKCYDRMRKQGVFALAFVATGAEAIQYITLASADRIPIVTMANGAPFMYEPVKRYVFSMRPTYTQEARQIVDALQGKLGAKRVAAIYMSDGLGFAGLEGVKESLAANKKTLAAEVSFLRTATDVSAPAASVMAAHPDAVVIIGNYRQAADVLKFARRRRWKTRFALVTAREGVVKEAGDAAEGLIMALLFPHPSRADLPTVALFQNLMAEYHPDAKPNVKMLEGFVHAMLLVKALDKAGPEPTREKMISALETMRDEDMGLGADYRISFSSASHQGFSHEDFSVVRGGQSVPIDDWSKL